MTSNTDAARSHFAGINLESGTARDVEVPTPSANPKKNLTALVAISVILLFGTAITLGTVFGLKKRGSAVSSSSSNAMVDVVPLAASDDEDPPEPSPTPQVLSEKVVEKQLNDAVDETVNAELPEASLTPAPSKVTEENPTESVMTVVKVVSSPSSYLSSDDSKTEKTLGASSPSQLKSKSTKSPSSYSSSDSKIEKFADASSPSQLKSKSTKSPSSYASIDTEIEETVVVEQPSEDIESMSMMVFTSIDEGSLSMKTETDTDMIKDSNPEPVVHYNDWDWDFDCYKGQEKMQSNRRALKGSVLRGTKKSTKKVSSPRVSTILNITHKCMFIC